jgi:hypothetical protein
LHRYSSVLILRAGDLSALDVIATTLARSGMIEAATAAARELQAVFNTA